MSEFPFSWNSFCFIMTMLMCCSCRFRQKKFFFLHHDVHNACIYTKKARAKTRTRKKRQLLWPTFRFCRLVPFNAFLWVDLCFFSLSPSPFVVFLGNCVMCWTSSLALLFLFVFPFISEKRHEPKCLCLSEIIMFCDPIIACLTCVSHFQELSACQSSVTLFITFHRSHFFSFFPLWQKNPPCRKKSWWVWVVAISLLAWLSIFRTQKQAPQNPLKASSSRSLHYIALHKGPSKHTIRKIQTENKNKEWRGK